MNLQGKTRRQIEVALREKSRPELLDIIYSLATLDSLLTAREIAAREHRNRRDVLRDINAGKYVDPVLGAGFFSLGHNSKKVSLAAANARRALFFVPVKFSNGGQKNGHEH